MGAVLSFGQDPRWRRALVAAITPRPDQRILDVATGTGLVASELVRQGAGAVVGLDQSEAMLGQARQQLDPARAREPTGPGIRQRVQGPRACSTSWPVFSALRRSTSPKPF
jgi:SAM-dependent methyltransferase